MPKNTFFNLSEEKRTRITEVLKQEFESKPLFKVNVKDIVEKLNIARGSFYQYFDGLEDSYYMILDKETVDVHELFLNILRKSDYKIFSALDSYGEALSNTLFSKNSFMIYKNRYLYWTPDLDIGWKNYLEKYSLNNSDTKNHSINRAKPEKHEEILFVKAVIHDLIQRIFKEEWDKNTFLKHYKKYIEWLQTGLNM